MTTPAPAAPAANAGKTLGIVGLILSFFSGPIGLILSAVARSQSKKAGLSNGPAVAGIIIGALGTITIAIIIIVSSIALAGVASQCANLGPGTHTSSDGITTINCG